MDEKRQRQIGAAIGAEIAYWRKLRGLSRQDLAAKTVGVSASTLGRYERGETVPDFMQTWEIAEALEVAVSVFARRVEEVVVADALSGHSVIGSQRATNANDR